MQIRHIETWHHPTITPASSGTRLRSSNGLAVLGDALGAGPDQGFDPFSYHLTQLRDSQTAATYVIILSAFAFIAAGLANGQLKPRSWLSSASSNGRFEPAHFLMAGESAGVSATATIW